VAELPTGTVTFLFTDIAGSTRLLQDLGAAYPHALAEHRRTLREVFSTHHGIEVDAQGDAFFFAFGTASDALAAAIQAQAALATAGEIRVRIGIHTGEPTRTDEGYVGIDVHRAARIAAAGHGGQILLSQSTRELVGPTDLHDLGQHRLKDVGGTRLYQVGSEEFPPLSSLNQTNLPLAPSPLVGRTRELSDVLDLLRSQGARLVTIRGPGGIGKTRLGLEVGRELLPAFKDGVWFVDLSSVRDAQFVEPNIAAVLGATGELSDHLRGRELLVILDNMEQVADAGPALAQLLESSPGLTVLATSRAPLHVRVERQYPLQPLDAVPAVQLFRERARALEPGFDADDQQVAAICQRLEGIPLAIELAAARIRMFSAEQLLARLGRRLPILTGGARDLPVRQQTLRAAIEWSYELLTSDERRLFVSLAVFAASWSIEAAEAVCGADLDTLQSLVDKSLLQADGERFRMLETVREFARQPFEASHESEHTRRRHAEYYLALAERAEPELTGADQSAWLDRLAVEYGNLRTALDWCAATPGGAGLGLRLAAALALFWYVRGPYTEGLNWLEGMLEAGHEEPAATRVGALWGAGLLWALVGDGVRARPLLEQSLALARTLGDHSRVARSLDVLGLLAFFRNDYARARELLEESVDVARRADDSWCLTDALGTLGSIYPLQGQFELAERGGLEGLAMARRNADQQGIRMALFGLALADARRGDLATARRLGEEGLSVCREMGDRWFVSYFLWILATVATASGEYALARTHADESLAVAREVEGPLLLVCALEASATVARAEGNPERAAEELTEAERIGRAGSVPHSYLATVLRGRGELAADRGDVRDATIHLEEALSLAHEVGDVWSAARSLAGLTAMAEQEQQIERARTLAGEAFTLEVQIGDQLGIAELLERVASIAGRRSGAEQAARLLGAAARIRERLGAPTPARASDEHAHLVRRTRRSVGAERYEALVGEGRDLSLDAIEAQVRGLIGGDPPGPPRP
jgi:predicted ATPase